ncbi:hypothetical protein ACFLUO_07310 [Chloroflexota bacterium]
MKKKEMTLEEALELLEVDNYLDSDEELEQLRRWVSQWVDENGEEWVKKFRFLIRDQWEALQGRLGTDLEL